MIFLPQHDYPVGVIPDECGECATNSGCRDKCTPSGKSLCVQAVKPLYGRSFVRLRRMRTLAELIPPCADPACLDVSQDGCFRHPDGFRGLPESVTHVLRSVP